MHAIILAAGVGQRLASRTGGGPKCLVRFGAASLLERQLAMLAAAGIERLTVITGHDAPRVERALADSAPRNAPAMAVETLFNPHFRRGSVLSALAAASALESGDDVLLMDADVLCDARMIERLMGSAHANCFLLDRDFIPGDEPVKLGVRAGRLAAFGKRLPEPSEWPSEGSAEWEVLGESVGFFRLAPPMAARLARQCRLYREQGELDAPHEDALRDLLLASPRDFGYGDVSGLPWIEIDYPEDLARATDHVLPELSTSPCPQPSPS